MGTLKALCKRTELQRAVKHRNNQIFWLLFPSFSHRFHWKWEIIPS